MSEVVTDPEHEPKRFLDDAATLLPVQTTLEPCAQRQLTTSIEQGFQCLFDLGDSLVLPQGVVGKGDKLTDKCLGRVLVPTH